MCKYIAVSINRSFDSSNLISITKKAVSYIFVKLPRSLYASIFHALDLVEILA